MLAFLCLVVVVKLPILIQIKGINEEILFFLLDLHNKEPDSGSSSTTTLSMDNEVKKKLLPQPEVESKRHQGAIPKQCRSKSSEEVEDTFVVNEVARSRSKRVAHIAAADVDRREDKMGLPKNNSNNELNTFLMNPTPPWFAAFINPNPEMPGQPTTSDWRNKHRPKKLKLAQRRQTGFRQNRVRMRSVPAPCAVSINSSAV